MVNFTNKAVESDEMIPDKFKPIVDEVVEDFEIIEENFEVEITVKRVYTKYGYLRIDYDVKDIDAARIMHYVDVGENQVIEAMAECEDVIAKKLNERVVQGENAILTR